MTGGLDYTLYTLQGNPEATWGEYTATSKQPTNGLAINFIQHPGGGLKKIGYWENSGHTTRCTVSTNNQTYGGSASASQMGYGCDSEGGSSGSPVMDAGTGRIIGLHHFGGVTGNPCRTSATQMRQVCSNAGSLLSCATNQAQPPNSVKEGSGPPRSPGAKKMGPAPCLSANQAAKSPGGFCRLRANAPILQNSLAERLMIGYRSE